MEQEIVKIGWWKIDKLMFMTKFEVVIGKD